MEPTARCAGSLSSLLSKDFFKALGDQNRLALLVQLATEGTPQRVGEAAACCPVDLSVVSRHLKILREAGLVDAERRGKEIYYRVRVAEIVSRLRALADALEACCPDGVCALEPNTGGER